MTDKPHFIVHVAGGPVDMVQRCIYCRAVLQDHSAHLDPDNPEHPWYSTGQRISLAYGDTGRAYDPKRAEGVLAENERWCNTTAPKAPWRWMEANGLPPGIPDDAELVVDEEAGTITVEVFATDPNGRMMLHAGTGVMTRLETFPLKVPPAPRLLEAYQRTVDQVRRERNAATAIRHETAQELIRALDLDPIKVYEALRLPVPTSRLQEST